MGTIGRMKRPWGRRCFFEWGSQDKIRNTHYTDYVRNRMKELLIIRFFIKFYSCVVRVMGIPILIQWFTRLLLS